MSAPLQSVSFKKGRGHAPRLSAPYVPGKRHERFWTESERDVLRQHYAEKGFSYCAERLPNRTRSGIYLEAYKLGLNREGRKQGRSDWRARYPQIDEQIRAAWPEMQGRGAVGDLAQKIGVPRWLVSDRVLALGLSVRQRKEPRWSAAEDALLAKVPLHNPDRAAAIFRSHGFVRTPTAIVIRCKRVGLARRYSETMSATQAAQILGVDNKTVTIWCLEGALAADRRASQRLPQQGGAPWSITAPALRAFVVEQIDRIDIRKVDKVAFVALLTGALDRKPGETA